MTNENLQAEELIVGVIGGSGLYEIEGLEDVREEQIDTPFGDPSDSYLVGTLDGVRMVFLPRHGRGHRIPPSKLNFRANLFGMKALGVNRILSLSAVGSMREDVVPGHFVVIDQFIDRTRHRPDTFFDEGIAAHVMFADPTCDDVRRALLAAAADVNVVAHDGGTYLNMEGPQFSTRAESHLYRSWGVDVIGMTNLQEAKLAREAEICYATVAMVTDFDCWHAEHDDVAVDGILEIMRNNVAGARRLILATVPHLKASRDCACKNALQYAIMTDPARIPTETRAKLGLLIDKYISE